MPPARPPARLRLWLCHPHLTLRRQITRSLISYSYATFGSRFHWLFFRYIVIGGELGWFAAITGVGLMGNWIDWYDDNGWGGGGMFSASSGCCWHVSSGLADKFIDVFAAVNDEDAAWDKSDGGGGGDAAGDEVDKVEVAFSVEDRVKAGLWCCKCGGTCGGTCCFWSAAIAWTWR